jgi:hypothetical protein
MRAILIIVLIASFLVAGCRSPEQPAPEAPNDGDTGDGLETVAPGGGGGTLGQRIERLTD